MEQINPRTEFPLALAVPSARTRPTEEVGLVVKTARFRPISLGSRGDSAWLEEVHLRATPPFTIHASFLFSHRRKGCFPYSPCFFFFFFSLLSPRERKHREAGGESGLRTRGARAASNARVGSCPYMFDVLLITNFFALTSEYY